MLTASRVRGQGPVSDSALAGPDRGARSPRRRHSSRCSMSRKPVFLARTPRLVSQVSAHSTTPTASSPPAIVYWIQSSRSRAQGPSEEEAGDRADHRHPGRRAEGAVGRRVAAQHQAGDVDHREHARAAAARWCRTARRSPWSRRQKVTTTIRPSASSVENDDRRPRACAGPGAPCRAMRGSTSWLGQPVEQPAGHQHVDQGGVGDGEDGEEREDLVDRQARGAPARPRRAAPCPRRRRRLSISPSGITAITEIDTST